MIKQTRSDTGSLSRQHIGRFVADHQRTAEIKIQLQSGLQDHARIGFAPKACPPQRRLQSFGVIKAGQHKIEMHTSGGKTIQHRAIDCLEILKRVKAARDPRLVRNNSKTIATILRATQKIKDFRNKGKAVQLAYKTMIHIDHAVTI